MIQPDTRKLLSTGTIILIVGLLAVTLLMTVFGGVSTQGPHTNNGWLALMLAMGCVPTGALTLLLGAAKAFGDRNKA
ncbi:MAG: hypothetical protein ABI064_00120 [Acidobacteriaceae bacterium]